jgi:hypothetical protein
MAQVPQHPCDLPGDQPGRTWTCPTCGQRWYWQVRHTTSGKVEGWTRVRAISLLRDRGVVANLREAYELEQVAAVAPWWAALDKARARRRARALRRLEGQP